MAFVDSYLGPRLLDYALGPDFFFFFPRSYSKAALEGDLFLYAQELLCIALGPMDNWAQGPAYNLSFHLFFGLYLLQFFTFSFALVIGWFGGTRWISSSSLRSRPLDLIDPAFLPVPSSPATILPPRRACRDSCRDPTNQPTTPQKDPTCVLYAYEPRRTEEAAAACPGRRLVYRRLLPPPPPPGLRIKDLRGKKDYYYE
ncbi:hypothetical protein ACRALDRAFT_205939 [Sodiomyces alcalophilus JCM 7366]|uniref:uncharacterized protein n=1 Tax=Sodiomyces alcalophilus JCM 7366 TaxID=591952 RepID=UPI0039B4A3F7